MTCHERNAQGESSGRVPRGVRPRACRSSTRCSKPFQFQYFKVRRHEEPNGRAKLLLSPAFQALVIGLGRSLALPNFGLLKSGIIEVRTRN